MNRSSANDQESETREVTATTQVAVEAAMKAEAGLVCVAVERIVLMI